MIEKENHFQFKKFTLSDKAMDELRIKSAKMRKTAAKAQKFLEKELPFASEETLEMRLKSKQ